MQYHHIAKNFIHWFIFHVYIYTYIISSSIGSCIIYKFIQILCISYLHISDRIAKRFISWFTSQKVQRFISNGSYHEKFSGTYLGLHHKKFSGSYLGSHHKKFRGSYLDPPTASLHAMIYLATSLRQVCPN